MEKMQNDLLAYPGKTKKSLNGQAKYIFIDTRRNSSENSAFAFQTKTDVISV